MSRPNPDRGVTGQRKPGSAERSEKTDSSERSGRQNLADTTVIPERKQTKDTPPTESDRIDGHRGLNLANHALTSMISEPGQLGQGGWFKGSVVLSGLYQELPAMKSRGAPLTSFMLGIACVILMIGGGVWFFTN